MVRGGQRNGALSPGKYAGFDHAMPLDNFVIPSEMHQNTCGYFLRSLDAKEAKCSINSWSAVVRMSSSSSSMLRRTSSFALVHCTRMLCREVCEVSGESYFHLGACQCHDHVDACPVSPQQRGWGTTFEALQRESRLTRVHVKVFRCRPHLLVNTAVQLVRIGAIDTTASFIRGQILTCEKTLALKSHPVLQASNRPSSFF